MPTTHDQPTFVSPSIAFQRLSDRALIPAYQSELAAGMDLHACLSPEQQRQGGIMLTPILNGGGVLLVPTGLAVAIPEGFEGQVRPRSGLAAKHAVTVANAPGTIDADYRGELRVALINLGREPLVIEHHMRIAQLVIAPVARARISEAGSLDETRRGGGGFGSTGR
jgi:dUTP pyrophosphatase